MLTFQTSLKDQMVSLFSTRLNKYSSSKNLIFLRLGSRGGTHPIRVLPGNERFGRKRVSIA